MQAMKTAISIEKKLFDQADNLARTMNVSRSKLFVIALQDYIEPKNGNNPPQRRKGR